MQLFISSESIQLSLFYIFEIFLLWKQFQQHNLLIYCQRKLLKKLIYLPKETIVSNFKHSLGQIWVSTTANMIYWRIMQYLFCETLSKLFTRSDKRKIMYKGSLGLYGTAIFFIRRYSPFFSLFSSSDLLCVYKFY